MNKRILVLSDSDSDKSFYDSDSESDRDSSDNETDQERYNSDSDSFHENSDSDSNGSDSDHLPDINARPHAGTHYSCSRPTRTGGLKLKLKRL